MKVLQVNSDLNSGSAGRIAEDIGSLLINSGHESYIAYGRTENSSSSSKIRIGRKIDTINHLLKTRLLDGHGFSSKRATNLFLKEVEGIHPDIVHLHNIHGYYLNVEVLFIYLKEHNIPVVWTFHDCWPFTGHCSYFDAVDCYQWQSECLDCPNQSGYPKSFFLDNSRKNYLKKKILFTGLEKMTLVSPSEWLANHLRKSFFSGYKIKVINNGIDLDRFRQIDNDNIRAKYNLSGKYILGVANRWDKRKGLADFINLRGILDPTIEIVLLGLSGKRVRELPTGINGVPRTESLEDLIALYSAAEVFVTPTYIDNFPLTNIEALACGTPVITYNSGGSPETINSETGLVLEKGDIQGLYKAIMTVMEIGKNFYSKACRKHAELNFNGRERYGEYLNLYSEIIGKP